MPELTDLRHAPPALIDQVLALNDDVAEMTSPLTERRLRDLIAMACAGPAIVTEGRLDGFLLGFDQDAAYDSPNYLWFRNRLTTFAYIDRIVIAPRAQGRGLGRRLYAAFADHARRIGAPTLACEVNLDPPNPGSDAFHAALGFTELGRGSPAPGKVVRYLTCPVNR